MKCKARCRKGPSFEKGQYSVQCLASAAQHKLKVIYIIPCNGEYAALKEFAELEKTPNVPALDLPELYIVSTAKGFGCAAVGARTKRAIQEAFGVERRRPHPHRGAHQTRSGQLFRWFRNKHEPISALTNTDWRCWAGRRVPVGLLLMSAAGGRLLRNVYAIAITRQCVFTQPISKADETSPICDVCEVELYSAIGSAGESCWISAQPGRAAR